MPGAFQKHRQNFYLSQVFMGPDNYIQACRKSWLCGSYNSDIPAYLNEKEYFDPGTGPEAFFIGDVKAACLIGVENESPCCLNTIKSIAPSVVFHPLNTEIVDPVKFAELAKTLNAYLLVANHATQSGGMYNFEGGSLIISPDGTVLAEANKLGQEEVLIQTVTL